MKITKLVAAAGAFVLGAGSLALGVTAGPAQAASGNVSYYCQITDNVVASAVKTYTNIAGSITVTPSSVAAGQNQAIKLTLGGDGVTGSGPSPFNNGPILQNSSGAYEGIFLVSIDGGALTNVKASTASSPAAGNATFYPNGLQGTWTNTFAEGARNVKLEGMVFNSTASGPAWSATGTPTNFANAFSFDTVCSGDATDPGGNGGLGPPSGTTAPSIAGADKLGALSTDFTVTPATVDDPQSTTTTVAASPVSPKTVGTAVTFTATVAPQTSGTPAGAVQFKVDNVALEGAKTLSGGTASVTTSSLAVGNRQVTAEYASSDKVGADGFLDSTSASLTYVITAVSTPTPTPTPTPTDTTPPPSGAARSDEATLKVFCETKGKISSPTSPSVTPYTGWKTTLTVSPGAAKPGNAVNVKVALNATPTNGPATTLDPGAYTFTPTIGFEGKTITLGNGTVSQNKSVPPKQPIFASSQLPLSANSTITLPSSEGEYPVTLINLNFKNTAGSSVDQGLDIFDNNCNASTTSPTDSPKAFTEPTVDVLADASAADSGVTEDEGSTDGDGSDSGGVLAATGAKELLALAVLALIALQVGAIAMVRAQRATPKGPRRL